jgi:NAD(P)-dependent dehydrogenase (short-subunit alcohol dehydrogenase family)
MKKVAIVTGASRGLGRSMAEHLARQGVGIIGTYRNGKDEAESVASGIISAGGRVRMLPLDVKENAAFGTFSSAIEQTLKAEFNRETFDFLVNNAGFGVRAPYAETTEEQFDELVQVHFKAPFFLTQALLPLIADEGRILNVSSALTRFTARGYTAYAAAKGAVDVLTRYLAMELAERKIRVNVIALGAVATDFGGGLVRDNDQVNRMLADTVLLNRVGLPDDIGAAVSAILSDGFGWANGACIELSGGQSI